MKTIPHIILLLLFACTSLLQAAGLTTTASAKDTIPVAWSEPAVADSLLLAADPLVQRLGERAPEELAAEVTEHSNMKGQYAEGSDIRDPDAEGSEVKTFNTESDAEVSEAKQESELSLITDTPEEGFQLAIRLSRLGVTETQPDRDVLFGLREAYARDPDALIASSQVIAIHFQTVAAANNYWRK